MSAATPSETLVEGIELRPIRDDDVPFLRSLYASTRADEMALVAWTDDQRQAFLDQQFEAQHRYYRENYANPEYSIVELEGHPIGRLYLDLRTNEIRIVDIALMPEARGRGIGGQLVRDVLAKAGDAGTPVTIHVEKFNPARRLYDRLGFRAIGDRDVHLLMEWTPGSVS